MSGPDRREARGTRPNLDDWLARPALRVRHGRASTADPDRLWAAARAVRLSDASLLGRVIRWRIPGVPGDTTFDALLRTPPFAVLFEGEWALLAGLVGRIWTLRRDYPLLEEPEQFRDWAQPGTARVLFANWVEHDGHATRLVSETRVQAFGAQGRLGVAAVRPLVSAFQQLIGSEAIEAAVARAERPAG
jgi:hypothetical protein